MWQDGVGLVSRGYGPSICYGGIIVCLWILVAIEGRRNYGNDYVLCSEALSSARMVVKDCLHHSLPRNRPCKTMQHHAIQIPFCN